MMVLILVLFIVWGRNFFSILILVSLIWVRLLWFFWVNCLIEFLCCLIILFNIVSMWVLFSLMCLFILICLSVEVVRCRVDKWGLFLVCMVFFIVAFSLVFIFDMVFFLILNGFFVVNNNTPEWVGLPAFCVRCLLCY